MVATSLHIGDLDPSVTEADLRSTFKNFASSILAVKILSKRRPSSAKVEFSDAESAQSVRRAFNGELIKGSHITITEFNPGFKKVPAFNVVIKNFAEDVINRDLEQEFSSCGHIISTKVARDGSGHSRGFGFIQFDSAEATTTALARNGQEWRGERLIVELFKPLDQRDDVYSKSNLHVTGFHANLTKEEFSVFFSTFGEIKSSVLINKVVEGEIKNYGFIDFKEESSAEAALKALNGQDALGGILKVARFTNKQVRVQQLKREYKDKQEVWKKTNLVFKKLPLTLTEDRLRELCQQYGPITSIKIEFGKTKSTNTGYASFETAESAERAQKALNRSKIETQSVFVSHWLPQDELDRHLKSVRTQKRALK